MLSFQILATSALLASASARSVRDNNHIRMVKRQGTLVQSNDATNFGKCSVPMIKGALGFDNRKEFSFEPVNQVDYAHGSAQNIGIITQFICDTLVNNCGASTAAHNLCVATEAAVGAGKNDGAKADKFNLAFGTVTHFADAVGSIPSGSTVAVTAAAGAAATTAAASSAQSAATAVTVTFTAPCTTAPVATTAAAPLVTVTVTASATECSAPAATAAAPVASSAPVSSSSLNLGSCTNPEILFENGLDGRQQPAFIAANQKDFNHGSALNIAVITGFISQRFQSPCNAGADAVAAAAAGVAAAQAAGGKTGGAADAWNAAFGIKTNFAAGATNA